MKLYIPTNPMWYVAVVGLILPLILVNFVSDPWLIRLASYVFIMVILPASIFCLAFTKGLGRNMDENASLVKKYGKARMLIFWRIFLAGGSLLFLLTGLPDLSKDLIGVINGTAPVVESRVVATKRSNAITSLFSQEIVFDEKYARPENTFTAFEFPVRFFMIGNKYEIRYLPNTHIIVDAKLLQ